MTSCQVLDYVRQINAAGIKTINITGGEVFTAYGLLRTTVEAAGRHGLSSCLSTNGNWAVSEQRAREKLQPLVDSGLKSISVGCDALHQEYVRPERVRHALEAAHALGLELLIEHTSLEEPVAGRAASLFASLGLPRDFPATVSQCHVSPAGRALGNFSLEQLPLTNIDQEEGIRLRAPCRFVGRMPMITPSGDLAACCGVTVTTDTGIRREFVVGNLGERPLAELLESLEYDPLYTTLMVEGPWCLFQLVSEQHPGLFARRRFVNTCDLCAQVVLNDQARGMLLGNLKEQAMPLAVKKMMLELAREEKLAVAHSTDGAGDPV